MKKESLPFLLALAIALSSCGGTQPTAPSSPIPASTSTRLPATATFTPVSSLTTAPTPTVTDIPTQTPVPTVESLKATVIADKLSCRYGPGAEYLYLFAWNGSADIKLVGRTDANNWVWVANKDQNNRDNNCWVNARFLDIQGDPKSLPIVYPGLKLIVSPYYPGPAWATATRDGNSVEIIWEAVPISPGKYEDESMHQYIVEVWRCENGEIIFETLGTNFPFITVKNDEPGCSAPSHGFVYVQEKHGYGGPVEIPWPPHEG